MAEKIDEQTHKHLQEVQLMVLKDFIKICDKYDLDYYLFYGTLIGAVRHKGFIPWDDDIDIIMFRDDYEKFLEAFKKENSPKYEILESRYQDDYFLLFAKMSLKDTKYEEYWTVDIDFDLGIFIDIFVLDNVPDNKLKRALFKKHFKIVDKLLTMSAVRLIPPYPLYVRAISNTTHKLFKALNVKPKYFQKKANKLIRKYNNEDTEFITDLTEKTQFLIKKSDMEPPIKVPFEDIEAKIPNNYDYILRLIYGDYMQIPTEEERATHAVYGIDFGEY